MNMKKYRANFLVVAMIVGILGIFTYSVDQKLELIRSEQIALNERMSQIPGQVTLQLSEQITQVIGIAQNGIMEYSTMTMEKQGWLDFIRNYPAGVTISNLQIQRLFEFEEVDYTYPEKIQTFLSEDRPPLGILARKAKCNGVTFGDGFALGYTQHGTALEVFLEDSNGYVSFAISGGHAKKLYGETELGYELLIFSKGDELYAINRDMRMFRMI